MVPHGGKFFSAFFLSLPILLLPIPDEDIATLVYQYQLDIGQYLLPASEKVQISDWVHPTPQDFKILQNYLSHAPRPELQYINYPGTTWREDRIRNFKLIDVKGKPKFGILHLNGSPSNKKNCIVTYISCDKAYEALLHRLIQKLKSIGFDGHVIFRVGGWPNTEEGSLQFFDVPYAFKVYSILEAKRLGYKNCLWLDACIVPLKKLDPIFNHIDEHGVFLFMSQGCEAPHQTVDLGYIQDFAARALANVSAQEFCRFPVTTSAVVGFDVQSDRGTQVLNAWQRMLEQKLGFLSFIPEMAPLFSLIDRFNLLLYAPNHAYFAEKFGKKIDEITPETILLWYRQ